MYRFFSHSLSFFRKTVTLALIGMLVFPQGAAAALIVNQSITTSPNAASGLLLYYSFDGPTASSSRIGESAKPGIEGVLASITSFFTGLRENISQLSDLAERGVPVAHATDLGPANTAPAISSFTASPNAIDIGGSARLSWAQTNAQTCFVDNTIGSVGGAPTGGVNAYATTTTTYTLTCSSDGGTATASVTVYVRTVAVFTDLSGNSHSGSYYTKPSSKTLFIATSTSNWTVPADWNSSSNSVEAIGGGGGGGGGNTYGGSGGGGGGYAKQTNVALTAGATVKAVVGDKGAGGATGGSAGTAGTDTYFCNATTNCASISGTAVKVGAKGGAGGTNGSAAAGGAGGVAASGVGATKSAGGAGGAVGSSGNGGGGGGGAGGPHGAGAVGGASAASNTGGGGGGGGGGGSAGSAGSTTVGGAGGNNYLGTGGGASGANGSAGGGGGAVNSEVYYGGTGGVGEDWEQYHGSGGGGGAGSRVYNSTNPNNWRTSGGYGGDYGAGGGGGAGGDAGINTSPVNSSAGGGGYGAQGIIALTYAPTIALASPTSFYAGRIGQAIMFDGVSSFVSTSTGSSISGVQSVSFWAKANGTGASQGLVNIAGSSAYISTNSSKVISATGFTSPTYYMDGVASSTPGLYDSNWHQITVTTGSAITATRLEIGRANGVYFSGLIDDFRLYNSAITPGTTEDSAHLVQMEH